MTKKAVLLIVAIATVLGVSTGLQNTENMYLKSLISKLKEYKKNVPAEYLYVHTDKTLYKPGESIWFSAYLTNAETNKPSETSGILYVDLINPKGSVEHSLRIVANEGKANGEFMLDAAAAGGVYKVKAYTRWNQQFGEKYTFSRDLQVQASVLPRLLMKLDFIRKAYGAGDLVQATFKASTLKNEPLANITIEPNASVLGPKIDVPAVTTDENGEAIISFKLPDYLQNDHGTLNIIITHEGLNESIARSIPIVLGNDIRLSFFPESGDLVQNVHSNIAFKAVNKYNKPVDVSGHILNSEGKNVAEFSSFHDGMGAFEFTPKKGESYKAVIVQPSNVTKEFDLPEILASGYSFTTKNDKEAILIKLYSPVQDSAFIVAHAKGNSYFYDKFILDNSYHEIRIPTSDFPAGIVKITVFNSKGVAQCERLVFVNADKQLHVEVSTDKKEYLPREKVNMTVKTTNEKGQPVAANLSLAVVNDKAVSLADDKQNTILSQLLLSADVTGEIHEPRFYFDPEEEKAPLALDYLLLTQGWRRFTWREVQEFDSSTMTFNLPERTSISGVIHGENNRGLKVKIPETGEVVETSADGKFIFPHVDLTSEKSIEVQLPNGDYRKQPLYNYNNLNFATSVKGKVLLGEGYKASSFTIGFPSSYIKTKPNEDGSFSLNSVPPGSMHFYIQDADGNTQTFGIDENYGIEINPDYIVPIPIMYRDDRAGGERIPRRAIMKNAEAVDMAMEFPENAMVPDEFVEIEENLDLEEEPIVAEDEILLGDMEMDWMVEDKIMKKEKARIHERYRREVFYSPQEFYAPDYTNEQKPEIRTDFRETIYWNPAVKTNTAGEATVSFFNSDEITSFRTTVEGISATGLIGRVEYNYYTLKAVSLDAKLPQFLCFEDDAVFTFLIKNNSSEAISGTLNVEIPECLSTKNANISVSVAPESFKTIDFNCKVLNKEGNFIITAKLNAGNNSDAFEHKFTVFPKGFPARISMSGSEGVNTYKFQIEKAVEGSMKADVVAYPNILSDLMAGIESIIQEPYGCFEQTSSSTYPNILVMDYMQNSGNADPKILKRAYEMIDKGYNRLIAYETKEKGFEWFGSVPAHEGLSAYGLLEFHDMAKVYDKVDKAMVERTQKWLMSRKNGQGDFVVDSKALDNFGRAQTEINNAYILWALSETGETNFSKEYVKALAEAKTSKDPYRMALMARTALNLNKTADAQPLLDLLVSKVRNEKLGELKIDHTITVSYGLSAQVETAAAILMAFLKANSNVDVQLELVNFIANSRQGSGGFGSTQATIMALRGLTEFVSKSSKEVKSGEIIVKSNGKSVGQQTFNTTSNRIIKIDGIEKMLSTGSNKVEVSFDDKNNAISHTFSLNYTTYTPQNSDACLVKFSTELEKSSLAVGENTRLSVKLSNTKNESLPMVLVKVGIPSGLAPQPWQLKKMQEESKFSYYELIDNYLVLYYTHMSPNESKDLYFDLKAEIKGNYTAPASSAYLYYTNEDKVWNSGLEIEVK